MAKPTPKTCLHSFFFARLKGRLLHKRCRQCGHRWTEVLVTTGGTR
jgi:uncharacterized OB-fold protein